MKKSKLIQLVLLSLAMIFFQGCSDDNSSNEESSAGPTSLSISMAIKDGPESTDTDVSTISAVNPGYIFIHVEDQNGNAAANKVVSISATLAKASPSSSVLTDASGNASAKLEFLSHTGVDVVTVSTFLDESEYTDSMNYAVVSPDVYLGDNSGTSFVSEHLEVATSTLSANGTTSVSAYFVDSNGAAFETPVAVSFSSICSTLSPPLASLDKSVVTASGIATSTYQAKGCVGPDTVTASASFGGSEFTATGSVIVAPIQAGSIKFISATPDSITLLGGGGVGLQETSELLFQVLDTSGQPLGGQTVTFSNNGTAGGITFSPATAVSDSTGQVKTIVQSGSVPAVVKITATTTVNSKQISTQSTGLVIHAGLPDDDSFTLSPDMHNVEAWRYDGEKVKVYVRLADVYNNPPPSGTPVFFTAEGGSIGAKCYTDSTGYCSVTWVSANPRPADGRSTILAYTQGVESFSDKNGDGYLSDNEVIKAQLPEAFRDDNENTIFDDEYFADFNENHTYDDADTEYNGNLCNDTSRCSSQTTLNISRSFVIVFSDSFANISATSGGITYANQDTDELDTLNIVDTTDKEVEVSFSDTNGQPLPVGTTISIASTAGKLIGTTSYTVKDTQSSDLTHILFTISDTNLNSDPSNPDPANSKTGRLTITVSTPKNNQTIIYFPVVE
jgi:hypothetical protein